MKKSQLLLYHGGDFQSMGMDKYIKDVLHVGRWVHPDTGQEVDITQERLQKLAVNTEKYRQNVDKQILPFPDGHSDKAYDNMGDWPQFMLLGDRLWGVLEPKGDDVLEKIRTKKIRSVSPRINFNVKDSHGNFYDEVITHVCATPYPVTDGQFDFVKLSREEELSLLLVPIELAGKPPASKEKQMSLKALALALGLSEDADEAKILAAATKAKEDAAKAAGAATSLSVITAALEKEHGLKVDGDKVVKLAAPPAGPATIDLAIKDSDSPEVKALKTQLAKQAADVIDLKKAQALGRIDEAKRKALEFSAKGIVPPEQMPIVERLFAVSNRVQALALAKDGAAVEEAIDVAKDVETLLASLPKITDQRLAGGAAGDDAKSKEAEKVAQESLDRVLGKRPAAAGAK